MYSMLKKHFGQDYPIAGGNGSKFAPLVISTSKFLDTEEAITGFFLSGTQFSLRDRSLDIYDDRVIDKLVYDVSFGEEWRALDNTREFYFDVTSGYNN